MDVEFWCNDISMPLQSNLIFRVQEYKKMNNLRSS